jgi:hypothetical protein
MTIVQIFLLPFCLKHISYFHNILWLGTDAAMLQLLSYLFIYFFRHQEITYFVTTAHHRVGGWIWVVLLHHYIHTYKIMFLQHKK